MHYVIIILLTITSGLFSGLILGFMSLNPFELKRKASLGDPQAKLVYPLRRRGNLLLVTLIFGTTVVNAILTVFLDTIATGLIAVVAATLLIMIFGTLLPQALFSRIALRVGALSTPFVRVVIWVCWPICAPVAWLLDRWLGAELPNTYSKQELIKILEEHRVSPDSEVEIDEERIARGALTFGDRKVSEVMVPRRMITAIDKDTLLTPAEISKLKKSLYSRFPVYDSVIDNVTGTLYLRDLVRLNSNKNAGELAEKVAKFVHESESLDHLLNGFLKTRHHLFIVINDFKETVGVVSIEDVLEAIIDKKIVDEFDLYDDVRSAALHASKHKGR
jgi:metal transporter CNNM